MGKEYDSYVVKKFSRPSSFKDVKKVWIAQKRKGYRKSLGKALNQYNRRQEIYENKALLGDGKAKLGLNFVSDSPKDVKKGCHWKQEDIILCNVSRGDYAVGDDTVQGQPFGIDVRNVRCLKCRQWGHITTDKICPLFGSSITAEPPPAAGSNPGELMEQMAEEGLVFTNKVMSRQNDPSAANQQLVHAEADADEEIAFFRNLSTKEKKKLLKWLEEENK